MDFQQMTDKELAHYAYVMSDPVLSSPLEIELANRFVQIVEADQSYTEMRNERDELKNRIALIRFALIKNRLEDIRRLCA